MVHIQPLNEPADTLWNQKYRYKNETYLETFLRQTRLVWPNDYRYAREVATRMAEGRYMTGGRIMAGLGTDRGTTLSNCYVLPIESDSMKSIMEALSNAAMTMKAGGGVGYNFSILRPRNAPVGTSGAVSSGPISFMRMFDTMSQTVSSAGNRRGASIGILNIWHPDIEDFIEVKQKSGVLDQFNISVGVCDDFMTAVEHDLEWNLRYPDTDTAEYDSRWVYDDLGGNIRKWDLEGLPTVVYKTVRARDLWEKLMRATYEYSEPGVLFLDTINNTNLIGYTEYIQATNPCGEIPMSAYGACILGSVNIAKYISEPFTDNVSTDFEGLDVAISDMIHILDHCIENNVYPLEKQREEALRTRQIGLGITGLGDALAMLGIPYDSVEAEVWVEYLMQYIHKQASKVSSTLGFFAPAIIQGERHLPLDIAESEFENNLLTNYRIRDVQRKHSRMISIAPTGSISFLMGNVSSGIEPIFMLEYKRRILNTDGTERVEVHRNYAWDLYCKLHPEATPDTAPEYFRTALEISPEWHVRILSAAARNVDQAISKTVNVPEDMDFIEFSDIYTKAHMLGIKGITTYRPNDVRKGILQAVDSPKESVGNQTEDSTPTRTAERLLAERHRIPWKNGSKVYLTVSKDASGKPVEVFAKLPKTAGEVGGIYNDLTYLEHQSNWEYICRLVSKLLQTGMPLEEILDDAEKSSFYMSALPSIFKRVLGLYVNSTGSPTSATTQPTTDGPVCPDCGKAVIKEQSCLKCVECGWSKCS